MCIQKLASNREFSVHLQTEFRCRDNALMTEEEKALSGEKRKKERERVLKSDTIADIATTLFFIYHTLTVHVHVKITYTNLHDVIQLQLVHLGYLQWSLLFCQMW